MTIASNDVAASLFRIGSDDVLHGMGWVTVCDIPANTTILDEELCFSLPLEDLKVPGRVEKVIEKLDKKHYESFRGLYGESVVDKLYLNGAPLIEDLQSDPLGKRNRQTLGIFLQYARLNHSCRPNACAAQGDGTMCVVSQRDIAAGEEITISYLNGEDNFLVAKERIKNLRSNIRSNDNLDAYADGCSCRLCTSDTPTIQASDERRTQLRNYRQQLLSGSLSSRSLATFVGLMANEGIPHALMGVDATIKLVSLLHHGVDMSRLSLDEMNSINFTRGTRVRLGGLRKRPELNGSTGVVVDDYKPAETAGRVAVLLDSSLEQKPIAVKPDNLVLQN